MKKILYVEDNEDNIYMLKRRLTKKGFDVVIAENGQIGVDLSQSEDPDLILMDLSLPVMDGWDATQLIKSNPKTQSIPIIVLSANAMEEHKQRALAAGADDYDTKPVDLSRLLSKMAKFIELP